MVQAKSRLHESNGHLGKDGTSNRCPAPPTPGEKPIPTEPAKALESVSVRSVSSKPEKGGKAGGVKPISIPEKKPVPTEPAKALESVSVSSVSDSPPVFPLEVYPPLLQNYIKTCARSIYCPVDTVAVPILVVAGAAIGRTNNRLKFKDGHTVSSCIWAVLLDDSGGGKTPALNFAQNFYIDYQEQLINEWKIREEKRKNDKEKKNQPPEPYPCLTLTDTTNESLKSDLCHGAVLYLRDELDGWCKQMGQYKSNNADRADWCSFWSHSSVHVGRKGSGKVFIKSPFVSVGGMMVPRSYAQLNYGGHEEDGLIHRFLTAYPQSTLPVVTKEGVPDKMLEMYGRTMIRLFTESNRQLLTFSPQAAERLYQWVNEEHYAELNEDSPSWLKAKYRKLWEYVLRLSLVLHELRRVFGEPVNRLQVDRKTVDRAIILVTYFKGHIPRVQEVLHLLSEDDLDHWYNRLRRWGLITVRECVHKGAPRRNASREQVLSMFNAWAERGYGEIIEGRKNQATFCFKDLTYQELKLEGKC